MSQFTEIVEMLIEFFTPYSGCGGKPHRLSPPPTPAGVEGGCPDERLNIGWWLEDSRSHTQSGPIRVQVARRSAIGSRTNSAFAAMRSRPRRARL